MEIRPCEIINFRNDKALEKQEIEKLHKNYISPCGKASAQATRVIV